MRFRFSLRMSFVLVALLAAFCYFWFVMPTVTAKRFVQTIAAKDYAAADQFFSDPEAKFIASSADKYWAFESNAELLPWTLHQLLVGQRSLVLNFEYFHLDQNVSSAAQLRATPFGLKSPVISRIGAPIIIDTGSRPDVQKVR